MISLYQFIFLILNTIPYKENGLVHKTFVFFLQHVFRYRLKVIHKNLANSFPLKNENEIVLLTTKYYGTLVAYIFETIQLYSKNKSYFKDKIFFHNPEVLENNNGVSNIILDSHFGNWEMSNVLLPLFSKTASVGLYKPLSNQYIDQIVKEKRSRFGLQLLSMGKALRTISKETSHKTYIFISDQSPASAQSGDWIHFLNQETLFYTGAEMIAKKFNFKVFYKKTEKINGVYEVTFVPIYGTNIIEQYAALLEDQIKLHPELWLWSHKRWKHTKT